MPRLHNFASVFRLHARLHEARQHSDLKNQVVASTLVDHQSWLIIKAISKQLLECTLCQLQSKITQNVGLGKLVALEYVSAVF